MNILYAPVSLLRSIASLLIVYSIFLVAPSIVTAEPIIIDTVVVGNVGNADDPLTGRGGVSYEYRIGTTEVTNAQYAAFLNEKAKSDPLALYNTSMGSDARGGITRSGVSGSFSYATKTDMANKPVNLVTWYDVIRFTNWLNNGQGAGDTENGAYTLLGGTATPSNGNLIVRNPGATWFLPSDDEWYKAAYHQPLAQGGDSDDYWLYSTASNSAPMVATADSVGNISNPGANVANYNFGADWNAQNGNLTTVGSAGPLSYSFYATADQAGNVSEWTETLIGGSQRITRGGAFNVSSSQLPSSSLVGNNPTTGTFLTIGFRVATVEAVPEPSTLALAGMGAVGVLLWGVRRKAVRR